MVHIRKRPAWHLTERDVTSESAYRNRREFLKAVGVGTLGLAAAGCGSRVLSQEDLAAPAIDLPLPAFETNPKYADAGRPLSAIEDVTTFNNFYEFGLQKEDPVRNAQGFKLDPYLLKVDGLVDNPMEMDLDQIETLGIEERIYRFRCVEAWGMTVPWIGVPVAKIIEKVQPKSDAKYVRFKTFYDPEQAPGQKQLTRYPWPYFEGLRLDEAMNELTFFAVGLYGRRLPEQSGTPLRLIVPWKYGFKGPKSIVQMTFVENQPDTFWNTLQPAEYKFYSNVDPNVSHPRWSQATEWRLGNRYQRYDTLLYNGYEEQVAHMYEGIPRTLY